MTCAFIPARVLPELPDGAAVVCSDCSAWGIRRIDGDELMERLLADWPVAGMILARVTALMPTATAGALCRKGGLAAYAAVLEDEDRHRLLAFVDAVVDCAADQLQPADKATLVADLTARILPVRVQFMLNETRAHKRNLAAVN